MYSFVDTLQSDKAQRKKTHRRKYTPFWIKNYKTEWEVPVLISLTTFSNELTILTHYCLSAATLFAGAEKLLLIKKENSMEQTRRTIRESFQEIMFA